MTMSSHACVWPCNLLIHSLSCIYLITVVLSGNLSSWLTLVTISGPAMLTLLGYHGAAPLLVRSLPYLSCCHSCSPWLDSISPCCSLVLVMYWIPGTSQTTRCLDNWSGTLPTLGCIKSLSRCHCLCWLKRNLRAFLKLQLEVSNPRAS